MPEFSAVSPAQLAAEWGVSKATIYNLVASGELHALRLGKKLIRIPRDSVEDYLCQPNRGASRTSNEAAACEPSKQQMGAASRRHATTARLTRLLYT